MGLKLDSLVPFPVHSLLPHCVYDVIIHFTLLVTWLPCYDGLYSQTMSQASNSILKLLLSQRLMKTARSNSSKETNKVKQLHSWSPHTSQHSWPEAGEGLVLGNVWPS